MKVKGKGKGHIRFWALKVFIATLIISSGVGAVCELFLADMDVLPSVVVVLLLVVIGVVFDVIGVAFSSCEQKPFIAMSSRKIKKARKALMLLKNAEVVGNICNDVIGDICGIVSGAAGAAIAVKLAMPLNDPWDFVVVSGMSGLIAACTVGGKALGKKVALKNNVKIVETIGAVLSVFDREKKGASK